MSVPALDFDQLMAAALEQAYAAQTAGEVPVGAVVVHDGAIIGRGHNRTEQLDDPTAHAEILALRAAAEHVGDWRLDESTLVVTLEPCPMCFGAVAMARVERLVYGARDPRFGACGSAVATLPTALTAHLREIRAGVREDECSALLKHFFRALRER